MNTGTPVMAERRWTIGFLVAVIVVMMVQNYLLVKKAERYLEHVNVLRAENASLTLLNTGDSTRAFVALSLDSSSVLIDPTDHTKTLLFVFTSRCKFCHENMKNWNALAEELKFTQVVVFGITTDSLFTIKRYREATLIGFPTFSVVGDSQLVVDYKLRSFPQTILLDSLGVVINVWSGVLGSRMMENIRTAI